MGTATFQKQGGDVFPGQGFFHGDVVVTGDDHGGIGYGIVGDGGQPTGEGLVKRRNHADVQIIGPTEELPGELEDFLPAGVSASQLDDHNIGLGAGEHELHPLRGRNQPANQFRPLYGGQVLGTVMGASGNLSGDCFHQGGVGVSQYQAAVTHGIIDILIAVDVPLARAAGVRSVDLEGDGVAGVMVDAATAAERSLPEFPGLLVSGDKPVEVTGCCD